MNTFITTFLPNVSEIWDEVLQSTWETLYMTLVAGLIAGILGVILGVILVVTEDGGILESRHLYNVLDKLVNKASIEEVVFGSSALVASSQSSTSGSFAKARAMATRCFCPPDNWEGYALAFSDKPTNERSSATLSWISFLLKEEFFKGNATLS